MSSWTRASCFFDCTACSKRRVSSPILRVARERAGVERALVLEDLAVHRPELALLARGLGGERGGHRVRVHRQRLVLPDDAELAGVGLLELLQRGLDAAAERALEVGEQDHRELRVRRAAGRVVGPDRHLAVDGGGGRRGGGGVGAASRGAGCPGAVGRNTGRAEAVSMIFA